MKNQIDVWRTDEIFQLYCSS